jgi:hypothetical protein
MHCRKEAKKIMKRFKGTQIILVLRTRNTIQNMAKLYPQTDGYEKKVYQMKSMGCPLKYIK